MVARKLAAILLLTAGLGIAVANTASAQGQTVTAKITDCNSQQETIRPLGAPRQYSCTLTVEWAGSVSDPANPVTVQISVPDQKSYMDVILSPSAATFIPPEDGEGERSQTIDIAVSLTQAAPAFESKQLTLQPDLNVPNQEAQSAQETSNQIAVTPGYFNLYNVRLDKKIGEGSPDSDVTYPIELDNFSNGDTRFEFTPVSEDNIPAGYQPVIPSALNLRSEATGGDQTKGTVTLQVFTPFQTGYVNRIASIQMNVDSKYAADTSIEGASSQVATLTKTKGFYVPGPGVILSSLGVLGAALVLQSKRDRWN
jgi:hypothetical protein